MNRVAVTVAAVLCLAPSSRAGEWGPLPERMLTVEGVDSLAGTPLDDFTPAERAAYRAWQVAVVKNNQRYVFWASMPEEHRASEEAKLAEGLAYLQAHRREAVWALLFLVDIGRSGPGNPFRKFVDDGAPREMFAELLSELADRTCVELLKQAVQMRGGPVATAAPLLAELAPEGSAGLLIAAAGSCPARSLPWIVQAVGKTRAPEAEGFLIETALEAGSAARAEALRALAHYQSRAVFQALTRSLENDRDNEKCALAALCQQEPSAELFSELRRQLKRSSSFLYAKERDLISAATARQGTAAIPPLVDDLINAEWEDSHAAEEALQKIGPEVVPWVMPLVDDPEVRIRCAALSILGSSRDLSALPGLVKGLNSKLPEVRRRAAMALGQTGLREVLPHLGRAANDVAWAVRRCAANALSSIPTTDAVGQLVALLEDPKLCVAVDAAHNLRKMELPEARAALKRFLSNGNADAAHRLLWSSDLTWVPNRLAEIAAGLSHPDAKVRAAAARAVRFGKSKKVIPALVSLLEDVDKEVRKTALDSLRSITGQSPPATSSILTRSREVPAACPTLSHPRPTEVPASVTKMCARVDE
ncbi:MAG: HEAT repeat domain-containing protein [Planctomycetota bacterium]